ncbi:hypothetical protein GCM10011390_27150 [Aureimonas endophytica]|uniref:Uncharacterized protein n=1 Tax=Aureimonas endophytica TaxID=2027858 RepID=A0A917E5I1_9HYPH|nr:hypothetical protein [Aureimonas endophytica]GGE06620.1 hypothetical protein GCM10011390_27150 [Aureimonas endophytica]
MRPATLADACRRIIAGEPEARAVAECLDSFYLAASPAERLAILAEEPPLTGRPDVDAYIGAIAEYLAKRHALPQVPEWAGKAVRYLAEPWFAGGAEADGLREFLVYSSPAEFRSRKLFVEARPLRRARTPREAA